ncbi:HET-C-related protein [Pseudomonas putida]|uniref:HET-C-related protein n=1 Tax=Pseudomonas putida TaxID=303 RepID=UPI0009A1FEBD|nr:HET-C-related protein [Pseudomonas putida]
MPTSVKVPTLASFESTHALDQLMGIAKTTSQHTFELTLMSIYGYGVPVEAITKLHGDLRASAVINPAYRMAEDSPKTARYDRASQTIEVGLAAVERALEQPQTTPLLLMAILRAFADHVGHLIGADAADSSTKEAAEQYLATLALLDRSTGNGTVIAKIEGEDFSETILLNLSLPTEGDQVDGGRTKEKIFPTLRFEAGTGSGSDQSFGHESIEKALATAGFTPKQRKAIYFGNWLRDYSQLVDPKLVRAEHEPKDFPRKLSRATLTNLVDFLALKEFHSLHTPPEDRENYKVTTQMLGVYRPSEHIDNPLTLDEATDPQSIDPDFEPLRQSDHESMQLDHDRSMYRYFEPAQAYMYQKLIDASIAGPTPEGMRFFGEALHVLEDLFAHSNFVELSLRKVGHTDVLAWTTPKQCRHERPLVTGLFSGTDVLASVLEPVAKVLFPAKGLDYVPTLPGERSDKEQMLLILLREHEDPQWLQKLEGYLAVRDKAADQPWYNWLGRANHVVKLPLKAISYLIDLVFQNLLKWAGDNIDDLQLLLGKDPNIDDDTHPTHSQLAKDHDTHPFHALSSLLAQYAVEEVGRAMYQYWQGDTGRDPASLAKSYFTHPYVSDWQDDIVQAWALRNQDNINDGCSSGSLSERRAAYQQQARERLRNLENLNQHSTIKDLEILNNLLPSG